MRSTVRAWRSLTIAHGAQRQRRALSWHKFAAWQKARAREAAQQPPRWRWRPKITWALAILGLPLGAYLILSGLVVTGIVGERAAASNPDSCHALLGLASSSYWYACDVTVRWPDGSAGIVSNVPMVDDAETVMVARPKFHALPFPGDEHRYKLTDLIALVASGVVCTGRAVLAMFLLRVTSRRMPGGLRC